MQRSALFAVVCTMGAILPAFAQSSIDYPKTADEAISRISDEERERVAVLRERILESTAPFDETTMEDYIAPVPKAAEYRPHYTNFTKDSARLDMVAIRGGEFLMGSPPDEPKRADDEGPQVRVKISPFLDGTLRNDLEPL